jgi:hypothetical protein
MVECWNSEVVSGQGEGKHGHVLSTVQGRCYDMA